jgi:homoserine kinase type II
MSSETWLVDHQGSTYVAKRVPPSAVADLVAGAEIATALAEAGFVTGPPVPMYGPTGNEKAAAIRTHPD